MKKPNVAQFYVGLILAIVDAILVFMDVISDTVMIVLLIIAIALIGTSGYRLL